MGTLTWVILLLVAGLVVVVLELFVPSGGILGVTAVVLFLAAILLLGFEFGPAVGFFCLLAALIVLPAGAIWMLRWWPNSPMGRRILPQIPDPTSVVPDNEQLRGLRDLLGKVGRAKTVMLPSGAAVIDGRTVNAMSEGMPIEAGQAVRVVEVRGNCVIVRPTSGQEQPQQVAEDDLSKPIDALGLEPLDDTIS
jgi:membrane-bound ClpP family serine protease